MLLLVIEMTIVFLFQAKFNTEFIFPLNLAFSYFH